MISNCLWPSHCFFTVELKSTRAPTHHVVFKVLLKLTAKYILHTSPWIKENETKFVFNTEPHLHYLTLDYNQENKVPVNTAQFLSQLIANDDAKERR